LDIAKARVMAASSRMSFWGRVGYRLLIGLTCLHLLGVIYVAYITARGDSALGTLAYCMALGVATLLFGVPWAILLPSRPFSWSARKVTCYWLGWAGLLIAVVSMPFIYWPMRIAFALQRPQIDSLARRVEQGDMPKHPVHLGFYTVTLAEVNKNGVVCLWICPGGIDVSVSGNFFNLNVQVTLADQWQFIEED
jgi:hypothetical protein